ELILALELGVLASQRLDVIVRILVELRLCPERSPHGPAVGSALKPEDSLSVLIAAHEGRGGDEQAAAVFVPLDAFGEEVAADDVARQRRREPPDGDLRRQVKLAVAERVVGWDFAARVAEGRRAAPLRLGGEKASEGIGVPVQVLAERAEADGARVKPVHQPARVEEPDALV